MRKCQWMILLFLETPSCRETDASTDYLCQFFAAQQDKIWFPGGAQLPKRAGMIHVCARTRKLNHRGAVFFSLGLTDKVLPACCQQRIPLSDNLRRSVIGEIVLGWQSFQPHHHPIPVLAEQAFQGKTPGQDGLAEGFHGRRHRPGAGGGDGLEKVGEADLGSKPDASRLTSASGGWSGIRVISAFALISRSTSRVENTAFRTSASCPISRSAWPIIWGRTDR